MAFSGNSVASYRVMMGADSQFAIMSKFRSCADLCSSTVISRGSSPISAAHRELWLCGGHRASLRVEILAWDNGRKKRGNGSAWRQPMIGQIWQGLGLIAVLEDRLFWVDLQFPLDRPWGLAASLGRQYFMTFAIAGKQLQSILRRCRCRPLRHSRGDNFIWWILTAPRSCVF